MSLCTFPDNWSDIPLRSLPAASLVTESFLGLDFESIITENSISFSKIGSINLSFTSVLKSSLIFLFKKKNKVIGSFFNKYGTLFGFGTECDTIDSSNFTSIPSTTGLIAD